MATFVSLLLAIVAAAATNAMDVNGGHARPSSDTFNLREKRVVHGIAAALKEYPFVAEIRHRLGPHGESEHFCGASIISQKHLVTAAHCVDGWYDHIDNFYVVAGQWDTTSTDGTEQTFDIESAKVHHSWEGVWFDMDNDVAVIKIKPNSTGHYIEYNDVVQPILLPEEAVELEDGLYCYVLGWGQTHLRDSYGFRKVAEKLQGAKVPVIDNATCASRARSINNMNITKNMFCAGSLAEGGGIEICRGDSGGPFACKFNDTFRLMGVVSWANPPECGDEGHPGVYVKLSNYLDWVRNATMECRSVVVQQCTTA